MTRIGKGKTVVLVVSDKDLKSTYCMIEALRVFKSNNQDKRIFMILLENGLEIGLNNIEDGIEKYQNIANRYGRQKENRYEIW